MRVVSLILILFVSNLIYTQQNQAIISIDEDSLPPLLNIKANKLIVLEDTVYTEYGIESHFKRFEIQSKIQVQTGCNGGIEALYDSTTAVYEIALALENNSSYGTAMVDSIYKEWSKKSESLLNCFVSCSKNNYFLYANGYYILYNYPQNLRLHHFFSLYFADTYIKVSIKSTEPVQGWGGLSAFMDELCYFIINDTIFRPGHRPTITPQDFFIWYNGGKFKIQP